MLLPAGGAPIARGCLKHVFIHESAVTFLSRCTHRGHIISHRTLCCAAVETPDIDRLTPAVRACMHLLTSLRQQGTLLGVEACVNLVTAVFPTASFYWSSECKALIYFPEYKIKRWKGQNRRRYESLNHVFRSIVRHFVRKAWISLDRKTLVS